jgi:hypothetical protein
MSIFIELFVSKKVLAQKGQKTLKTQPSKTCLDAKFRYKDGSENRFWKNLLWEAGVMRFGSAHGLSEEEQNSTRTKEVLSLEYESPFRIGLCVYISMPSPAGGPWSGVAGIRKLLSFAKIMELCFFLCYNALHETSWKPKRTGKTSAARHRVVKAGKHHFVGCGASSGSVQEFCLPMATGLS